MGAKNVQSTPNRKGRQVWIHQDVDPELGEVPDLEGYRQREGVRDVKLGDELPEDQRRVLKDLVRRYPDVFTDMPGETDAIQHQIRLTDDTPIRCQPYPLPYAMRSGYYAGDGSGETVDIAVRVAHRHGEEEGWFQQGVR